MKYFTKIVGPPKILKFSRHSKIPNFPEFQKTPKFRGKGDLIKKDPKFSIFTVFFTKFCGAYQVYAAS